MPRRFLIRENANPEVENALKDPYSNPALQADVPGTRKAVATHIPSSPFLFNSPISAHPRPMHGRHPHLSSPSPLSPSNRHTRLHKDSQSHPSARMQSKHSCCPSLHLLDVRTTSARRLLASPAACSPLQPPSLAPATLTAAPSGCRRTASTAPLSILPPVAKAPSEDDIAFRGVSYGEDEYWA